MFLLLFFYFIYIMICFFSLEYFFETIESKFILSFYILLIILNLCQTFFLIYKFFIKRTLFYYKSIIVVNSLFFIINLFLEYTNQKNILPFLFQIFINIFNIIFILPKESYIYNEIEENTTNLSNNEDYPEATYL